MISLTNRSLSESYNLYIILKAKTSDHISKQDPKYPAKLLSLSYFTKSSLVTILLSPYFLPELVVPKRRIPSSL